MLVCTQRGLLTSKPQNMQSADSRLRLIALQIIFTDGSKSARGVGAAAVFGNVKKTVSLPEHASIFTAELKALQLALKITAERAHENVLICSDSMSSIVAIKNGIRTNELVRRLRDRVS